MSVVRLALVRFENPVSDPTSRNVEPMSTAIASEALLVEADWDGVALGDVQVFKNAACNSVGKRLVGPDDKPLADDWRYLSGVPRGRVLSYRFLEETKPRTVSGTVELPFELNAERKEKSRQATARGTQAT